MQHFYGRHLTSITLLPKYQFLYIVLYVMKNLTIVLNFHKLCSETGLH